MTLIPTDLVPSYWPSIKPFVEKILEGDTRNSLDWYLDRLCEGRMQIWAAVQDAIVAVMITEIHTHDNKKVCHLLACVGEQMNDWIGAIEQVENWARSVGCQEIEPIARKGWERALRPYGYKLTHVVLCKDLGDGR